MVRRSASQFKIDDRAYPIRVKFVVPEGGMGSLSVRPDAWLKTNLDHMAWAWGPAHSTGCFQATAYYFRSLADAQRFVSAFPELELADGVDTPTYTSPAKSAGSVRRTDEGHAIDQGEGRQG
jgi:hypothetical protein